MIDPGTGMVVGSMIGAGASLFGGSSANSANRRENAKNLRFQEHMSNTAHRREVIDLREAGLNPILSATGGNGASTPSGGAAKIEDEITPAVTTALDSLRLKNEVKALQSQTDLNTASADAAKAGAFKDMSNAKTADLTNRLLEAEMPSKLKHAEFDKNAAGYDALMKRIIPATNAVGNLIPKAKVEIKKDTPFDKAIKNLPKLP